MAFSLGTYTLDLAPGQPPRRSFRRLWPLDLPPSPQGLRVAPETQLQAEFLSLTFNALAPGAPVVASRANQGDGVRITLELPLRLHRVVFTPGVTGPITVHRVDGSAIAEQPTTSASVNGGQITLTDTFVDRQFILKRAGGTLTIGAITELWVISYPSTPRFGLLDQAPSPGTVLPLWQAPGQLTVSNAQSRLALAAAAFQPLERFLAGQALPTLTLVAESDAPCRFQLSRADLSYRLTYQGFSPTAAAPAKQVLRFQGSDLGPQSLPLTLPPQVRAASLSLSLSLGTQQQPADSLAPVPPSLPSQRQGVELQPQQWGGLRFTPPAATRCSGVALGLLLLRSASTLTVELHADESGLPGEAIAQATLNAQAQAQPQWLTARFPSPVVLYGQPYWLLVQAREPALWLTQPGDEEVFLLERPPQTPWATRQRYPQTQALHQLVSPVSPVEPGDSVPAGPHPALALQIANVTLPTVAAGGRDRLAVDLMAGLPPTSSGSTVTLTVSTTTPGLVTIYAPTIEYEP